MNALKKYNTETKQWETIISEKDKAKQIYTEDSLLIKNSEEQEESIDVESVLIAHQNDIDLMKANISWLALHGGGGSGSGSSDKINTTLYIVENNSPVSKIVWTSTKSIIEYHLSANKSSARYTVTFMLDYQVLSSISNISGQQTNFQYKISNINRFSSNYIHSFKIIATDQFDDTTTVEVEITESNLEVKANSIQRVNISDINDSYANFQCKSTIIGDYIFYYSTNSNILNKLDDTTVVKKKELSLLNSSYTTVNLPYSELIDVSKTKVGSVFTIYGVLINKNNTNLRSDVTSSNIYITSSTELVLSSISLSIDNTSPSIISKSSVLYSNFIAYLDGATNFNYYISAIEVTINENGEENIVGDSIYLIEPNDAQIGQYNNTITVTFNGFSSNDFFEIGKYYRLTITVINSGDTSKRKDLYTYIQVSDAGGKLLPINADTAVLFDYRTYGDSNAGEEWIYNNNSLIFNNNANYKISSSLTSYNIGGQSGKSANGNKFRYCNKAYGIINNFVLKDNEDNIKTTLLFPKTENTLAAIPTYSPYFTLSIAYQTDYSPSDERTILNMGDIKWNDENNKYSNYGIVINNHDYRIMFEGITMSGKLLDSTFNQIDIVYNEIDNNNIGYIKVYQNGILLNVNKIGSLEASINRLLDFKNITDIQIAHKNVSDEIDNICDVDIYSLKLYNKALNPYQIVCNYINNYVIANLTTNGIDNALLNHKLNTNMIVYDSKTETYSCALWNDSMQNYNDSNWLDITNGSISLADNLSVACPLPIVVLDFSNNSEWTFDYFKQDMSKKAVEAVTAKIGYFINGTNQLKEDTEVEVSIQGTTTRGYAIKNVNIDFGTDKMFWVKDDWFPEQIYTLKADIVDSAHANNACIGKFINDCASKKVVSKTPAMSYFDDNKTNTGIFELPENHNLSIKHTLEGFPILLLCVFAGSNNKIDKRSLGIYSFNLGRESYHNMGYKLLKCFKDLDGNIVTTSKPPMLLSYNSSDEIDCEVESWEGIDTYNCTPKQINEEGNFAAEKSSPMLFNGYFWSSLTTHITHFWESKYPSKGYSTDEIQKLMNNIVKDCTYTQGDVSLGQSVVMEMYAYEGDKLVVDHSSSYAIGRGGATANYLNIQNARFYYLICMLTGLVDNLGKNLNMRIWKSKTISGKNSTVWYTCFYDMDTAFGEDNGGGETISPSAYDCSIKNVDGNIQIAMLNENTSDVSKMYSVYSNKLWGVLDDAMFKRQNEEGQYISPDNDSAYAIAWDNIRNNVLINVDAFIDKYFENQISECGEMLYNQDFYVKYLTTSELDFMHGNRKAFVKNWIIKRIKFLDSLFGYLNRNSSKNYLNDIRNISDASYNKTVRIKHNSGVTNLNVTTNNPIILSTVIGGNNKYYTYVEENTPTSVRFANDINNPGIFTTINNSDTILKIDNLKSLKIVNIEALKIGNTTGLIDIDQYGSFSSFDEFDLSNNTSFVSATTGPIDFLKLFKTWNTMNVSEQWAEYAKAIEPYQLRKINLSNTATKNVNTFALNLNGDSSSTYYKNPFVNLTDIDISNSCVTSVALPTNVSLYTLKLNNSAVSSVTLTGQAILDNVDFTGCVGLNNLSLINCTKYKKLTLTKLTNLSNINIVNCKILTDIDIDCTGTNVALTFTVANMSSLKTVKITNSVKAGGKIELDGAINLESLTLTGFNGTLQLPSNCKTTLKTLDLSYSTIKTIVWVGDDVDENYNDDNILDLRSCIALTTFKIDNNRSVEYIRFDNDYNNPIKLNYPFKGCTNLKRIYGNILLNTYLFFYGCTKFSIHGSNIDTVQYNGINVVENNIIKHPTELGDEVYDSNNDILKFQNGDVVTNMSINNTNAIYDFSNTACTLFDLYYILYNIGNATNLESIFRDTTSAKFTMSIDTDNDVVYNNSLHVKTFKKCNNVTSLAWAFRDIGSRFIIYSPSTDSVGNVTADDGLFSPLVNCTNFSGLFFGNTYLIDRFVFRRKPLTNEVANVYNIKVLDWFTPTAIINNANVNNIPKISTISDAELLLYLKNAVSNPTAVLSTTGNLSGFFTNFKSKLLSSINYLFYNTNYINFDTLKDDNSLGVFPIPYEDDKTTTNINLQDCFRVKYGKGELELNKMFVSRSRISGFMGSFYVENKYNNYYVTFKLGNNTFKEFTNLQYICNKETGDLANSFVNGSFCGNGIIKSIELDSNGSFPYAMFKENPKLINITALFYKCSCSTNCTLPGTLFSNLQYLKKVAYCFYDFAINDENVTYSLTSNGFEKSTSLQDVSYLFGSSKAGNGKLKGFIPNKLFYHGKKTNTVTYVGTNVEEFEIDYEESDDIITPTNITITENNIVDGTGTITYIVYNNVIVKNNKIICSPVTQIQKRTATYVDGDNTSSTIIFNGSYGTFANITKTTASAHTYDIPNATIETMQGCFINNSIEPYNNNNPTIEKNPNYIPFKYLYNSNTNNWEEAKQDLHSETFIWDYDGVTLPSIINGEVNDGTKDKNVQNYEYLDDVKYYLSGGKSLDGTDYENVYTCKNNIYNGSYTPTNMRFCCPPDLLRYCTTNVNISYLFSGCGYTNNNSVEYSSPVTYNVENIFGLKGRLCSYLLKPVPNVTNMSNTFAYCNMLTGYKVGDNGIAYKIPEKFFSYSTNVSNLTSCFSFWEFPENGTISVFSYLTNVLTITNCFKGSIYGGTSNNKFVINNVFNTNSLNTNINSCFGIETLNSGEKQPLDNMRTNQYINFGANIFPKIKYATAEYVFNGYNKDTITIDSTLQTYIIRINNYISNNGTSYFN